MAIAKKVAPWQHFVSVNGSQVDLLKPNWGAVNSKHLVFGIFWVSGYSPDYTTHFRTIQFLVLSNFQIGSDAWCFFPASCRVERLLRWWRAEPGDDTLGGSGGERYQNSWWFTETVCSTWKYIGYHPMWFCQPSTSLFELCATHRRLSIWADYPLTLACGAFSGKGSIWMLVGLHLIEVIRLKSHPPVFSVNTYCGIELSHCSPQESPPSRNEPSQQSATIPKHLPWKILVQNKFYNFALCWR